MELYIMVYEKTIKKMVLVNISIKEVRDMKENGKMILKMEKVFFMMLIVAILKVISKWVKKTE